MGNKEFSDAWKKLDSLKEMQKLLQTRLLE